MAYDVEDTIIAIASPPGSALRGIIRISGPETVAVLQSFLIDGAYKNALISHQNVSIACNFPIDETTSVEGDLLLWPTTKSFTGQPSAEIHSIGSTPILQMLVERLVQLGGRIAEPGEFTMRAFLSGRIDLTQAEAVLGVIDSTNDRQFENSLKQLAGGIATPLSECRDRLLSILAELEAGLDFVEEDIEFISHQELESQLVSAQQLVRKTMAQLQSRQSTSDRIQVVMIGKPNAGKSSLFNCLTDKTTSAIVTDIAGTTRDYIVSEMEINSVSIQLIDTAGLHFGSKAEIGSGTIDDAMGHQTDFKLREADILLLCSEANFSEFENFISNSETATILVATKRDLKKSTASDKTAIAVSSIDGSGIDNLRIRIGEMAAQIQTAEVSVSATANRTFDSLTTTEKSIDRALSAARLELGEEVVAAEIRESLEQLGRIVGVVYTDDILDLVFSRFCIGK